MCVSTSRGGGAGEGNLETCIHPKAWEGGGEAGHSAHRKARETTWVGCLPPSRVQKEQIESEQGKDWG